MPPYLLSEWTVWLDDRSVGVVFARSHADAVRFAPLVIEGVAGRPFSVHPKF